MEGRPRPEGSALSFPAVCPERVNAEKTNGWQSRRAHLLLWSRSAHRSSVMGKVHSHCTNGTAQVPQDRLSTRRLPESHRRCPNRVRPGKESVAQCSTQRRLRCATWQQYACATAYTVAAQYLSVYMTSYKLSTIMMGNFMVHGSIAAQGFGCLPCRDEVSACTHQFQPCDRPRKKTPDT